MSRISNLKFIGKQTLKNYKRWIKNQLGKIHVTNGSTHAELQLDESIAYINEVFEDYLLYGGLKPQDLSGKKVMELGPGDNMGVALLFIANGAEQVYLVDKYYSIRSKSNEIKIYQAIRERLNNTQQSNFDEAIEFSEGDFTIKNNKLISIYGKSVEDIKDQNLFNSFDLIVSRAVLQVVNNLRDVMTSIHTLLKEGGMMLHKVDLRDYGTFRRFKKHELGMLMFSSFSYSLMTNHSSLPNRKRINYYRKLLQENHFKSTIFISHIFGEKEITFNPHKEKLIKGKDYSKSEENYVEKVRPLLAKEFRKLTVEDLLISGVFIKAIKK